MSLTWSAPAECIAGRALQRAVADMLQRPVWVSPGEAHVALEGSIAREAGAWVVRLELRDAGGVLGTRIARRSGGGCRSLDRTVVVIVALLADLPRSNIVLFVPAEPAHDPGQPARGAAREPAAGPSVDPSEVEVRLGLGPWGDAGMLPGPTFGGQLALALVPARGWPALRLAGRALVPASTGLDAEGRGATVWSAGAAAHVCPEVRAGALALGACAGLALDVLFGAGVGLDGRSATGLRWAAEGLGTIAWLHGGFRLELGLGAGLTLARDRFIRDGGTEGQAVLHEPAAVSLVGGLAATVWFGS